MATKTPPATDHGPPTEPLHGPATEPLSTQQRHSSLWPEAVQSLDPSQAAFVLSEFDPRRAEAERQRQRLAGRLALCQPALSLRVLLALQLAVAVAIWPAATGPMDALLRWAGPAAAALGGGLLWLALVCALRQRLVRHRPARVHAAVLVLGGLAGVAGWALLWPLGLARSGAWPVATAALAGLVLAQLVWAWMGLREAASRPADAHARLTELQSRIRPHFLFNALNTALALVQVDAQRAETVLEDLSALFRAALAETSAAVTLDDEIDLAQRYLAIERVRFADRLLVEWEIDPEASAARLPPLVLQPLVENAVRHGVEPASRAGLVRVRTRAHRGMAEVEVTNTLPDEPGPAGSGMALANVRERLRLLHDLAAELHTWEAGGMHHARLRVPLS